MVFRPVDILVRSGGGVNLSSERYTAIDYIKGLAAFAIVCIHTEPFSNATIMGGRYIYFIIDTLARFAVPFFFIVSGFLFVKKIISCEDNGNNYYYNYFKKLAQLYFGWTIFYFLYYVGQELWVSYVSHTRFHSLYIPEMNTIPIIKLLIKIFYLGYAGVHLWYLIALLWSITVLFLFYKYNKLNILLLLSFVLNIIGLFGNSYRGIIYLPFSTRNAIFFGLFYCTLGGFFAYHEKEIHNKISRLGESTFGYLVGLFCGTQLIERALLIENFHDEITGDFFVSTIPLSICLFLWVLSKRGMMNKSLVAVVGATSVGIYVIHYFFISMFWDIKMLLGLDSRTVIYNVLLTPFIFTVSYFSYGYLQKIKSWLKS